MILFVYGTLRATLPAHPHLRGAKFLSLARVPGRLYRVTKTYPGLVAAESPDDWVHGELYQLESSALANLDAYEGPDFERVRTVATRPSGERAPAWVYRYRMPVREESRIVSGDFLA